VDQGSLCLRVADSLVMGMRLRLRLRLRPVGGVTTSVLCAGLSFHGWGYYAHAIVQPDLQTRTALMADL
jgi:hypothetical protein